MIINIIDDNLVTIDGKTYRKEPEICVAAVQHPGCSKTFYFKYDTNTPFREGLKDRYVIVETMYGERVGYVCDVKLMQENELLSHGAYFPLKSVLRYATDKEVREAYESELPF